MLVALVSLTVSGNKQALLALDSLNLFIHPLWMHDTRDTIDHVDQIFTSK